MSTLQLTIDPTGPPGLAGAALLVVLAVVVPGPLAAQTSMPDPDRQTDEASADHDDVASGREESRKRFDDKHRREIYRKGKLDYETAALRTALFPGLGNFYARQYFIGGLNTTLMAFTAVLIPYGLATNQPAFAWAGVGVAGAAYTSGFVTSAIGVRRYNRRLRRRLRLNDREASASPFAVPGVRTLTISIQF